MQNVLLIIIYLCAFLIGDYHKMEHEIFLE